MSKIGKIPIEIVSGVNVNLENRIVKVTGVKGTLSFNLPENIDVKINETRIEVMSKNDNSSTKALFGLTRATISNMIIGITNGFEKKLELSGVGYRAQTSGDILTLSLGFSHPVIIRAPEGVTFVVSENIITISGIDKTIIGDVAAKIRAIRPPEPYKGKGIKYLGEKIRRKAGKAAKAIGK